MNKYTTHIAFLSDSASRRTQDKTLGHLKSEPVGHSNKGSLEPLLILVLQVISSGAVKSGMNSESGPLTLSPAREEKVAPLPP
jgi:hypothetical protein